MAVNKFLVYLWEKYSSNVRRYCSEIFFHFVFSSFLWIINFLNVTIKIVLGRLLLIDHTVWYVSSFNDSMKAMLILVVKTKSKKTSKYFSSTCFSFFFLTRSSEILSIIIHPNYSLPVIFWFVCTVNVLIMSRNINVS